MTQRIALADARQLLIAIVEHLPDTHLAPESTEDAAYELSHWQRILGHPVAADAPRLRAAILAALRTRPNTIGPIWRYIVGYGNVDEEKQLIIVWLADLDIHLPRICAALAERE